MDIFEGAKGEKLRKAALAAVALLALFLGVQSVAGIAGLRYIGAGLQATNTIYISGHGEVLAVPDIATFTFSVVSEKTTVAEAQADATKKINAIESYLEGAGIDKKDIQTSDYSIYPQYEYQQIVCVAYPCTPGKQVLKGYEVRQTTTIKVRDTAKAGELLAGVGGKGATEVSGLTFTFDDPDNVQAQARDKAIADAKQKAQALAKELGVRLVRVVSFNENSYGGPIYYAKGMEMGIGGSAAAMPVAAPEISTGQNKVTSDVSITYEIR
ncbi:SIMPL domain-containing protein [Patescibacteria group bacterium]|nr:SIMPL domain-containing protein [Patescibacteria group bacterium]